jgi:hypothetical protein
MCLALPAWADNSHKAASDYSSTLSYESTVCELKSSIANSKGSVGAGDDSYKDLLSCIGDAKLSGKEAYKKLTKRNRSLSVAAKNYLVAYMTFLDSLKGAPSIEMISVSDAKVSLDKAANAFEVAGL